MKKILIVEDDLDIRESLIEILELNDFLMQGASNGKEGFDYMKNGDFDLVLCLFPSKKYKITIHP